MLCYVGHHDPAHDWASRPKTETNPVTGGAQIVVILSIIIFLKLIAISKANKDPAIIAGIRDFFLRIRLSA